jgi:23S rRNA pseudouridine955/2504/2580 synthase
MTTPSGKSLSQVTLVDIDEGNAGQRIDNFLVSRLKGVPKSHIYRILRKGEVRVNKGRIRANYRLQVGDSVRIPPVRQGEAKPRQAPGDWALQAIANSIIYEDAALLALNKPSGIAVHGGSGLSYGVIEALRALRPQAPYLELVHRLDRDTSGCLLIAKKRSALRYLHELLRGDGVDKRYLALVRGQWRGGEQPVALALQKNTLRSGERIVRVDDEGKAALSIFRPVESYSMASLVEVELKTGRTHQIRVHAAASGFPIAGDEKYGDPDFNRTLRQQGLKRLFLHARSLSFMSMDGEQQIVINAPLPQDLENVLEELLSK